MLEAIFASRFGRIGFLELKEGERKVWVKRVGAQFLAALLLLVGGLRCHQREYMGRISGLSERVLGITLLLHFGKYQE